MNPEHSPTPSQAGASRREFLQILGAAGTLAAGPALGATPSQPGNLRGDPPPPELAKALKELEPFFTRQDRFRDVSRGTPLPHTLPADRKRAVGMTRDTWRLEVVSDPEHPATLRHPLTASDGTALDFEALLRLGERRSVRFAKTMTCLNIGCPLGTGLWEGVPLRDVVWLTQPRENLRRVFYEGYHNDDPRQLFRSSLPIDRVLEDPPGLPPVILCYKLNGQWLESERGGPVRIVVPEAYGFKSIKWVNRVVLTNLFHANDTYAEGNNDVDSSLKTFAATFPLPPTLRAGRPIPVTGYAQVGVSGLARVQTWVEPEDATHPPGDPYFTAAPWVDAKILPPPSDRWGDLPEGRVPQGTLGFHETTGRPLSWPMNLLKVHWAALLPGLSAGKYLLRCRTVDRNGAAQPMPRPFQKSGNAAIETVPFTVVG